MSQITAEEAADAVQAREDAIRDACAEMDENISSLCNIFNLPPILTAEWDSLLASRIADQHEAHVSTIRQTLRLDSHNLRMFHARPSKPRGDDTFSSPSASGDKLGSSSTSGRASHDDATRCAAARLVALIVEAVKRSSKVNSLYREFDDLQSTLTVNDVLSLADIVFIRKTRDDLLMCRDKLEEDAIELKSKFAIYKKSFYLLSDETALNEVLRTLRGTTVPAEVFDALLGPAVHILQRLTRERAEVVERADAQSEELMVDWLSTPDTHVDQAAYDAALSQFDSLRALVTEQEGGHNGALMCIMVMFEVALNTPSTVLFSGDEIDLNILFAAFNQYEKLTELSREMIEASGPVIETLSDFVSSLRLAGN
ncbi:hypothetical protein K466DRAFT_605392 [Polyporus arcularius HHB13444]|uniref:Uncharacterized protein n=1 Tax=Polyporus arcularius HHB13444 TaxID=1314778 RepID=A0A5C3NVK6_9APHY|nr:hypothetical protein K466DRAFT_605392 [Polyporus arcularius HHB13444]